MDDVARVLRHGNCNAGGGVLDVAGESQLIQGQGLVTGIADLEAMVLANVDGTPIHLRDLAEVREDHEIRRGAVTAEGQGEVVLGLGFMLMGENSRELTQRLEARLEEVGRGLPEGVRVTPVYSRTKLVDEVLETVRNNLLEGRSWWSGCCSRSSGISGRGCSWRSPFRCRCSSLSTGCCASESRGA